MISFRPSSYRPMKLNGIGGAVGGGGGSGLGGGGGGGGTYQDTALNALLAAGSVSAGPVGNCRSSSSTRGSVCGGCLDALGVGLFVGSTGSSGVWRLFPEAAVKAIVTARALNRTRCRHGRALMTH